MSAARFPLEAVAAFLEIDLGRPGGNRPGDPPRGLVAIAEAVDVSLSTAKRWHAAGIPEPDADRIGCTLAGHPCLIWPEYLDLPVIDEPPASLFDVA